MPQVIAYVANILVSWGFSSAVATWVATIVVNAAVMFGAQRLLTKKPDLSSLMSDVSNRQQMVRQAIAPRRNVYGRAKVSGPLAYMAETGADREYLHLVILLASHEIEGFERFYLNEEALELDGSGNVTSPAQYVGHVRIEGFLGTSGQTALANLVSESGGEWNSNCRLRGIAGMYVRVKFNSEVFPGGLPNFSARIKGKKLLDPRTGLTVFSDNAQLCVYDYMRDTRSGLAAPSSDFDTDSVEAAANVCDETVLTGAFTLFCDMESGNAHIGCEEVSKLQVGMSVVGSGIPGSTVIVSIGADFFTVNNAPTVTDSARLLTFGNGGEKRYTVNGTLDTDMRAGDAIEALLSASVGKAVFAGGKWFLYAGAHVTPTVTLDENDLRGPIQMTTKNSRRDTVNGVKGTYVSEPDDWQPVDAPPQTNVLYLSEDGGERLWRDLQLPFTISGATAQRIFKTELERSRQAISVRLACKLTALKVQCGDTVMLNVTRFGWVGKVFEVTNFQLAIYRDDGGNPAIGVDLSLRETDSSVWDWNNGEETQIDPAPNTRLPNPFLVSPPTGVTATSSSATAHHQADGSTLPRIQLGWTLAADQYVKAGGNYRVQYKNVASSTWLDWSLPKGDVNEEFITDVLIGEDYDIRIRAENRLGGVSSWVVPTGSPVTVVGDTGAPAVPTGLTAVAGTGKAVSLDWTDNAEEDLAEYGVYRNTVNNPATSVLIAEVSASRFVDVEVALATTYYYWITAIDRSENESGKSSVASATTNAGEGVDPTPPSDPAAATLSASGTYMVGDGSIRAFLTINVPAMPSGANILNVLYRRNGATGWLVADQRTTGTGTVRIDDLSPATSYQVAVQAFSPYGYGSNIIDATGSPFTTPSDTTAPSTPSGLTAVVGTGKAVSLDWNDNTELDFSEYAIWRNTTNNFGTSTKIAETRASRFVDVDVTLGTTYYYWITAIDRSENQSSASSVASATPNSNGIGVDPTAPGTPGAITSSGGGTYLANDGTAMAFLTLSVPALPSLGVVQNVLYRRNGASEWLIAAQLTGASTVRLDDLTPGIQYDVALQAFSSYSIASSITTATGSPFTAPGKTATPNAPSSGSLEADPTSPAVNSGITSVLFGCRVKWVAPSDRDISYYELKATFNDTDSDVVYTWWDGGTGTAGLIKVPYGQTGLTIYNGVLNPGYVRIRSVDRSGNASSWLRIDNANAFCVQAIRNMALQNSNDVSVTSIRMGSSANKIAIAHPFRGTFSLAGGGGGITDTVNISLSGAGFSVAPDTARIQSDDTTCYCRYDWDDSTSTNAVIRVRSLDAALLPSSIRLDGVFIDYL